VALLEEELELLVAGVTVVDCWLLLLVVGLTVVVLWSPLLVLSFVALLVLVPVVLSFVVVLLLLPLLPVLLSLTVALVFVVLCLDTSGRYTLTALLLTLVDLPERLSELSSLCTVAFLPVVRS